MPDAPNATAANNQVVSFLQSAANTAVNAVNSAVYYATSPGKKTLKFGKKLLQLADSIATKPRFDKPINGIGKTVKVLELYSLVGDFAYWKGFFIRPLNSDRLNEDKVFDVFSRVMQKTETVFGYNEFMARDAFDRIFHETFQNQNYWNSTDFIDAFNEIVDREHLAIDREDLKAELQQNWSSVYVRVPIFEVLTAASFTAFDALLSITIVQDLVPFARIAEAMGKYGRVFIYIGTLPIRPFLSPIVCVALLLAVIESSRRVVMAENGKDRWYASWDLIITSSCLAVEMIEICIPLSFPVICLLDATACGIGFVAIFAKPAYKHFASYGAEAA